MPVRVMTVKTTEYPIVDTLLRKLGLNVSNVYQKTLTLPKSSFCVLLELIDFNSSKNKGWI